MGEADRAMLELLERPWSKLTADERALFERWVERARGVDLYLLIHHDRARTRRPRTSSSQTFAAIRETKDS